MRKNKYFTAASVFRIDFSRGSYHEIQWCLWLELFSKHWDIISASGHYMVYNCVV